MNSLESIKEITYDTYEITYEKAIKDYDEDQICLDGGGNLTNLKEVFEDIKECYGNHYEYYKDMNITICYGFFEIHIDHNINKVLEGFEAVEDIKYYLDIDESKKIKLYQYEDHLSNKKLIFDNN